MVTELPNAENTGTFALEVIPVVQESPELDYGDYVVKDGILDFTSVKQEAYYNAPSAVVKSVINPLNETVIAWDTETTGTNPTNSRLVVASFWDVSKPVSSMETFASLDEEDLTKQIAAYLNEVKPSAMVCYNNGFDQRYLLTRLMLYQQKVPGWNSIKQIDVMDILKKGTTQSIASSQAVLTEEEWFSYFFGESKPYTIEECFEALSEGDLSPFVIRNRTCTASEGWIYLLFREVTDSEEFEVVENRPTVATLTEDQAQGICAVECPACSAVNTVGCSSKDNTCYRCMNRLPDPTRANVIKEVTRDYDFSTVGLKAK
jgi:hypothetical protein